MCFLTFVVILALAITYERLVLPISLNDPLILDYVSLTVRCSMFSTPHMSTSCINVIVRHVINSLLLIICVILFTNMLNSLRL